MTIGKALEGMSCSGNLYLRFFVVGICCFAAGVQVASAADTPEADFIAFPTANGDLASATDWGDTPFPTESTHVKINQNGTYTLSADLSIGSVYAARNNIVFDFTDGNHTLTLNTMSSVWGGAYSLFQYAKEYSYPSVVFKGGVWKSASDNNKFWFVALGKNDKISTYTITVTDGCVITNVGDFHIIRRLYNTHTLITGGSRLYGKTMTLYEVSGTNNLLEIASGAGVALSDSYYGDEVYSTSAKTWGYAFNDRVDIHDVGSFMKVTNSTFVGRYSSGLGMRVRDGGLLETGDLLIGRCASPSTSLGVAVSSNNWMEVLDGGKVVTKSVQFYGPNNRLLVSNASLIVTNTPNTSTARSTMFTMGAGSTNAYNNTIVVSGADTVLWVRQGADCDVMGRYGHHNTFILENGAKWEPKNTCTFFFSSNNLFRVTGAGTVFDAATTAMDGTYCQLNFGPAERGGDIWATNTCNNVVEILDGAELRANRLFVHGWNNKIVVSNATITAGSREGSTGSSGYSVWLGRQTSSNCVLVLQGTTPKVRALYSDFPRSVILQSASCIRYEIPREGYAAGYAPIELAFINPASASSRLEIECSEWAERGPRNSRELVLFRGDRSLNTSGTPAWFAGLDLNLPANVTCFIRDKELILKREVPGLHIILR